MTMHVRVGGSWQTVAPKVRVGGSWQNIKGAWVRVAGVWQKFYSALAVAISDETVEHIRTTATANAGYQLHSDGTIDLNRATTLTWSVNGGTWLTGGASSDAEVRATLNSGSTPSGSALSTWLNLGTTRNWYVTRSANGTTTCNLTVEIRDASTLTVLDSATIVLTATVDPNA
jgi:hypothetical protein